jgi:hypothetical protein
VYVGILERIPAEGCFTVQVHDRWIGVTPSITGPLMIRVYSMTGALVHEGPAPAEILLPGPGIYLVKAHCGTKVHSIKVLVR